MDVRSLRYALTLADELHFGRAAQAHYIAAQPFGRRIAELEHQLGTRLFERTSRRVRLTDAGERFLPRARRVLAELDALMSAAEGDPAGPVLRVGVLGFGLADRWPATRSLLAASRPGLRVAYIELDWPNQYDAVRTGEVDVAIVHDVGGAEDLDIEPVMDTGRYAVVPAESEFADAAELTEADVSGHPRIGLVGQPGLAEWNGRGEVANPISVRSPAGVPIAVATTGCIGLHGEPAMRFFAHPGVCYRPLTGPHATVAIATRRRETRDTIAAFRTAARASTALTELEV
ncbi:LysR family transcriptional regulator [Amycolatopsis jejuensis]|uniref:LysR family transcriptional regulator n=1 Tax=Amycolatopsis jejuensis TaxID=330084 RepID=UPI000524E611|nr:LysR family transcriptional regulator [Amycolatopsis jejuensis]